MFLVKEILFYKLMELVKDLNVIDSLKNNLTIENLSDKLNYYYKNCLNYNLQFIHDKICNKILYLLNEKKIYNFNGLNYLIENHSKLKNLIITEYYEGQKFFLFFYKKNFVIINNNSIVIESSIMYKQIFNIVKNDLNKLNKNYCYHFILINNNKDNIIDYSKLLEKTPTKLIFLYCVNGSHKREFINNFKGNKNIIYPKKFNNISEINLENDNFDFTEKPKSKGFIIFIDNKENLVIKLQNFKYQFYKAIGPKKHIFNGFLDLYQKDKLGLFMKNNLNHIKFNKLINPYNNNEVYDTISCIDSLFKSISNELFNIYIKFIDINNNFIKIKDNKYINLPLIYKKIIKYARINKYKSLHNFYTYLKKSDLTFFINLVKNRKLFNNWIIKYKQNYIFIFKKTNKLRNKLAAVYVSKLFPEITKDNTIYKKT